MSELDPRQDLHTLVARLRGASSPVRPRIVRRILPLLADERLPPTVRVLAAARVLRFIPDQLQSVRRVVRSLTLGSSPQRALERLHQLQNHIETCDALDAEIDARERRLKLKCPRCRVRLPRARMIEHLWYDHGLAFDRGKSRTMQQTIALWHVQKLKSGDSTPFDRAAGLAGTTGLRLWLACAGASPQELAPLLAEAAERGCGLCPGCLAEVPARTQANREPLELVGSRLFGEGYAIEIRGNRWLEELVCAVPHSKVAGGRRTLTPRGAATIAAASVLAATAMLSFTTALALLGSSLAVLAYLGIRRLRNPEDLADRLIDAAWLEFAAELVESPKETGYLSRLCLTSLGRGDPELRLDLLYRLAKGARERIANSEGDLQLLAATSVLQVEDEARYGRDVVAGIAVLVGEAFEGKLPGRYAEYVVGCYYSRQREDGERGRLRILLLVAAFDAGLVPRDLLDLWAIAPNLKLAMSMEPAHRLGLLFGLWRSREARPWRTVANAITVFDLARTAPPTAARVLAQFPDLLLFHRPEEDVEELVGPVSICSRGVAIGGYLTADPDAEVQWDADGRALRYGQNRIELARELPDQFLERIRQWLRFRTDTMLPFIDGYLMRGSNRNADRLFDDFCKRCPACGSVSALAIGAVGRKPQK